MTSRTPNYAAGYIIGNFCLSYIVFTNRHLKQYYGIDHNRSPREDVTKYGEQAVKEGKISQRALDMIKRNGAAEQNSIAHFPFFCASMLFALHAGLPASTINKVGAVYTAARAVYGVAYILIEDDIWATIRSAAWWVSNITCMWTLVQSGKAINA